MGRNGRAGAQPCSGWVSWAGTEPGPDTLPHWLQPSTHPSSNIFYKKCPTNRQPTNQPQAKLGVSEEEVGKWRWWWCPLRGANEPLGPGDAVGKRVVAAGAAHGAVGGHEWPYLGMEVRPMGLLTPLWPWATRAACERAMGVRQRRGERRGAAVELPNPPSSFPHSLNFSSFSCTARG